MTLDRGRAEAEAQDVLASTTDSSILKILKEPVIKRDLTTREKIIVLEGSKLHGCVFPPWVKNPEPSEFALEASTGRFTDNTEYRLSRLHFELFEGWHRPPYPERQDVQKRNGEKHSHQKHDLVQDIIADCSVVASLCAITARTERGHPDILESSFFPYDRARGRPGVSSNGRYTIRLNFNGCYRKVTIDDQLPATNSSRALHVIDRNDPTVYWPALLEKAYLKIRGGYDFPGSNSGTDLWVLTGWLPEQIFLQSTDIDRAAFCRRVLRAFTYGDVLITLGTGKLTEKEEKGMGLVGEHDYAVIDAREHRDQLLFLIKNPWSNGRTWKGCTGRQGHIEDVQSQLSSLQLEELENPEIENEFGSPGAFWMPSNEIFQYFESIYLNWNPGLFSHRTDVHFRWDLSKSDDLDGFLGSNPQYTVRSSTIGTVWLVLTRHFEDLKKVEVQGDNKQHVSDAHQEGFMSIYLFRDLGSKIYLSNNAIDHSPYVDSPNVMLKFDIAEKQAFTIALSEQAFPRQLETFTLSAFSSMPVEVCPATNSYVHEAIQRGAWTTGNSGGNASSPNYKLNPQYSMKLSSPSDVFLFLHNPREKWPINVNLVWAQGRQIQSVTTRDIAGGSGEYRKAFAFAEIKKIPAGCYTVVCSTFERGQTGNFELRIGSTNPCQLKPVTVAGAGRFITHAQAVIMAPGEDHWIAHLSSLRLNRLSVSAQSQGDILASHKPYCSPLRVSVELGQGPMKQIIGVSGEDEFIDARHQQISTPDVDIFPTTSAPGVWISLERLGCSGIPSDERVVVQILSDAPCEIGPWRQGDNA